jgi:uncharacterized caspase-like protein
MSRILHVALALMVSAIALAGLPDDASAQKRVALVVGNSAYQHTAVLANPKNDAADVAAALKKLGFQVVEGFDLDKAAFDRKVHEFAMALAGAEAGVLFYAGHGLQVGGRNYLVPINAKGEAEALLDLEMVRVDVLQRAMEASSKTNVLFLDACRNNPLARNLARNMGTRSTQIGQGLKSTEAGVGTLISFSTAPDTVASDGAGRNSPYAGALLKHIASSTDDLNTILINVRKDVRQETNGQQVPWEHSSLEGRFYFNPAAATADPVKVGPQGLSEAAEAWGATKDTASVTVLEAFVVRYKDTFYAELARVRIDELKKQQAAIAKEAKPDPAKKGLLDQALDVVLPPKPATGQGSQSTIVGNYTVEKMSTLNGEVLSTRQLTVDASKPEGAIAACAAACDPEPQCLGFDLSVVYGKCYLYKKVYKKSELGGSISGVRSKQ